MATTLQIYAANHAAYVNKTLPLIRKLRKEGMTWHEVAMQMNQDGNGGFLVDDWTGFGVRLWALRQDPNLFSSKRRRSKKGHLESTLVEAAPPCGILKGGATPATPATPP